MQFNYKLKKFLGNWGLANWEYQQIQKKGLTLLIILYLLIVFFHSFWGNWDNIRGLSGDFNGSGVVILGITTCQITYQNGFILKFRQIWRHFNFFKNFQYKKIRVMNISIFRFIRGLFYLYPNRATFPYISSPKVFNHQITTNHLSRDSSFRENEN